jgi:hypothetical protein
MNYVKKNSWMISAFVIFFTFILMNLRHLDRPYVIDEAAFPYGAIGVLENGNPFFYNGETRPNDLALWHPPLYILSLALHMVFWGTSPFSVRLFGLFCIGITVLVVALAFNKLGISKVQRNFAIVIFLGIYIFNPLVSESALIPDIDGTIAIPIIAAGLLSCIVLIKSGWSRGLFLTFVSIWALLSFTKFTIALLLLPIFVLSTMLSGPNRVRNLLQGLSSVFLGFLIFASAWKLLSGMMKVPFQAPFDYFTNGLRSKSAVKISLADYFQIATHWDSRITMWVGPSLLLVSILSAIALVWRSIKAKKFDPALILPLFAFYCFFAYNVIGGVVFTFPKYWVICVLPLAMMVSLELSRGLVNFVELSPILRNRFSRNRAVVGVLVAASLSVGANYVLSRRSAFGNTLNLDANLNQVLINSSVAILLVTVLFKFKFIKSPDTVKSLKGMFAAAMFMSVFLAQFTLFATLRNSQNSTTYYFNERGLSESIDLVQEIAPPQSVIIAPKDVGIQSGIPYYEDAFLAPLSQQEVLNFIELNKPSLVVTRNRFDYSEPVYPQYFQAIRMKYEPVATTNQSDLVIWIPK